MGIEHIDPAWVVLSAFMVLLMQAGFLCLEAGLTRTKNSINVCVKNISDFCLASIIFWAVGYGIIFGVDWSGLVGTTYFFYEFSHHNIPDNAHFIFHLMLAATAVTIVSGAIAERVRLVVYLSIAGIISMGVYPIFSHWVWGGVVQGQTGWLAQIGFVDFAGATVVHSLGGWVALALLLVIGPRKGVFEERDPLHEIQPNNLPLAMLGALLLFFGWLGFNGGGSLSFGREAVEVIGNTILAGSAGLLAGLIIGSVHRNFVSPLDLMCGLLGGLVSITASCHVVTAVESVVIGTAGGAIVYLGSLLLKAWRIDDVVQAVPVHLMAGIWGTICVAIFGDPDEMNTGLGFAEQLGAQLTGIGVCGLWAFGCVYSLAWLVNRIVPIRVTIEEEKLGLNITEHRARNEALELANAMNEQFKSRDLSLRAPVEPFTEIGVIADLYNNVISTLEQAVLDIQKQRFNYEKIMEASPAGIFTINSDGQCTYANRRWCEFNHTTTDKFIGSQWYTGVSPRDRRHVYETWINHSVSREPFEIEFSIPPKDGRQFHLVGQFVFNESDTDNNSSWTGIVTDITQIKELKLKLMQAQKLESIGQLAAGIAHEINTPIQFLGDNAVFLQESFEDIKQVLFGYATIMSKLKSGVSLERDLAIQEELIDDIDLTYLDKEIPRALEQTLIGLERVSKIVHAMKEFSHPGYIVKQPADLNKAIDATVIVCKNVWKTVADVELDLDPKLPIVPCLIGEFNQVILNMIVNSVDAIEELPDRSEKGTIVITTASVGDFVEITILDSGAGIPEDSRSRIFDPFFTSKEVGKGTGQGLSIAHNVIVNKHGGEIAVDSEVGRGTLIKIKLPVLAVEVDDQ